MSMFRRPAPLACDVYDCRRCNGGGEKLTLPDRNGTRQWQVCWACDGTGSVLSQYRTTYGPHGTEASSARAEWHRELRAEADRLGAST